MERMLGWLRALRPGDWGVPMALVTVAAVAFAAAYAASSGNTEDDQVAKVRQGSVSLSDTFAAERGPDGLPWTWMSDFAVMSSTGKGRYWLGIKAASRRRPRVLSFEDGTGEKPIMARIGVAPRVYVLGPVDLSARRKFGLSARPGATRVGPGARRKLAVFLSEPRLFRHPIVALPGQGFWPVENPSGSIPFNWLRDTGEITIRAAESTSQRALVPLPRLSRSQKVWLTFVAVSSGRPRELSVRGGGASQTLNVPKLGDSTGRRFTVGPIGLRQGLANMTVSPRPGPKSVGGDLRPLSVRLSQLEALPSRPTSE